MIKSRLNWGSYLKKASFLIILKVSADLDKFASI